MNKTTVLKAAHRNWATRAIFLIAGVVFEATVGTHQSSAQPLPEGQNGIAKNYPGDVGIASDPAVLFADNFESYTNTAGLTGQWDEAYHSANIRIATEDGSFFSGSKALELSVPLTGTEVSNALVKHVEPERDVLFFRYYAKFDDSFDAIGSSHNGIGISASYWSGPGSGPGIPADGQNKFLVNYEAWRDETSVANPGKLNAYIYHPEQRDMWGDHLFPDGTVLPFSYLPGDYGPNFVPRPNITPELDRWYSYELMVKANTPGLDDGRIAMWLDGNLISDFPNLRLRDTMDLKIDRFYIDMHIKSNTSAVTKKWADDVVVATSYIGPMTPLPTSDFDHDGDIDGGDFLAWQRGESLNPLSTTDLAMWQVEYGNSLSVSAALTEVPEPGCVVLLLVGAASIATVRSFSKLKHSRET